MYTMAHTIRTSTLVEVDKEVGAGGGVLVATVAKLATAAGWEVTAMDRCPCCGRCYRVKETQETTVRGGAREVYAQETHSSQALERR